MTPLKPMLAKDANLAKISYPLIVQPKLDGIRATVQGGVVYSRTLKRIPNAEVQAALGRPEFEGFDGELIVGDPTSASCYRDTSSFVMSESKRGADWTFYVFDLIDAPGPNIVRSEAVMLRVNEAANPRVQRVASMFAKDAAELEAMEAVLIEQGHEGAILRVPSGLYKHGRSTPTGPLLKLKRFVDFEAEVIGVYEEQHNGNAGFTNELGRTSRSSAKDGKVGKGTLGGLVLRALNGPSAGIEFRCGTGFDAAQRSAYWREWHENLDRSPALRGIVAPGAVAKVKSFPIGAKDKPRHPVFLGWRNLSVDG